MTKKKNSVKPQYAAPAVDRLLDILEFMAEHPKPYGVTELSRILKISTNSIFRIMRRLVERGYAETDPDSGGYRLGARFFSLGMSLHSRFELRLRARRHLEKLCERTGETSQIQVLNGDRMMALDTVNPPVEFFLQIVPGSRVHIHANAFGKSVLAHLDEDEINAALPAELPALTKNTITDKKKFLKELEQVRKTGVAYDREEYSEGIFCVGAPVFGATGEVVAGVGITGLVSRFDESGLPRLEADVMKCAADIAADVGYTEGFHSKRMADKQRG